MNRSTPSSITERMGIVSPQALDRLWRDRDPMARQRSTKPAFRSAVLKAMANGATLDAIEMALKANDAQGDGTRCRDNNFAKGVCRVLNGGQWEDFMAAQPVAESTDRITITLAQLQAAIDGLRRQGVRRSDQVIAFMLTSAERGVLGFSFGPDDDDVIGIPGAAA